MGKFDQQLAHWRELHRIALEDLEELKQVSGRSRKTQARAGLMSLTLRSCGTKSWYLHS
jgi:hypothetical protein